MQLHKLGASLSTIPNDSRHYYQSFNLTKSNVDLHNPFKDQYPLKFPKNKNVRKQTQTHMLVQTMQNPEKSCIRNYQHANRSIVFDEPGRSRRELKNGMFYSLSRESIQPMPLNRSSEDIGAPNNRKKANYYLKNKPNPILIGEKDLKHNSNLQEVWAQPRRHRDNGALCSETMVWKQKPNSSYLQLYKNKQSGTTSKRVSKFSILN